MNLVTLMGRLTADPQINDRITCASFSLAVDRPYKKDGKTETDFIPCRLLGKKKADFANHYLRKGMKILVSGRLQVDSYEKDGKWHIGLLPSYKSLYTRQPQSQSPS